MLGAHKPAAIVALFVVLIAGVQIALQGDDHELPLLITQLVLVESCEVDRHVVEDTYSARLRHAGSPASTDFARVTAKLVHPFGLSAPGLVVRTQRSTRRAPSGRESVRAGEHRSDRSLHMGPHGQRWDNSAYSRVGADPRVGPERRRAKGPDDADHLRGRRNDGDGDALLQMTEVESAHYRLSDGDDA